MIVGYCLIEIYIPSSNSLKGKRRILKSIINRVKNRFNVSIAEVDDHNLWRKATLGVACVSNNGRQVNVVLDKVIDYIEMDKEIDIIDYSVELV